MHKLVLFCKSYAGDFELLKILVNSYMRFNKDEIPFYISVPKEDYQLFYQQFHDNPIFLLTDEEITDELITETDNWFTPGYINQEIVKLTFWKKNIAENYFCVDSDSYFIRDFYYTDFMYDEETPYSVLVEDKELCVDPIYYEAYWSSRAISLSKIKDLIGLTDRRSLTCHNNTTFSSKVLESLEKDFLLVNKLSYLDILKISPFEFSWYSFWLQKSNVIPIVSVEPLFKMFHLKEQYLNSCKRKITEKDISRAYIGICINSNWAKNEGKPIVYNCDKKNTGVGVYEKLKGLKTIIKYKFPTIFRVSGRIFRFLRKLFTRTSPVLYDQSDEDYESYLERTIYYRNNHLMNEAFNNEYFVHNGPFVGMQYIQQSSGSAFLPKIIGSYEEPIQKWVEQIIISKKYNTILDVGCAEGYYAAGFALSRPDIEIIAYDTNQKAREKVKIMIGINNINNITVKAECSLEELNSKSQKGALVFCDIEGAEKNLLDPIMAPNLLAADILCESHDCVEDGITDELINRFYKTHAIEIVVDYPSRILKYKMPNQVCLDDYNEIINEHRAEAMRWLYMKSLI